MNGLVANRPIFGFFVASPAVLVGSPVAGITVKAQIALRTREDSMSLTFLIASAAAAAAAPSIPVPSVRAERAPSVAQAAPPRPRPTNRRGRFSALRGGAETLQAPSLWHVDVSHSGKVCVADASGLELWRPNAAEAVVLSVSGAGGSGTALWPAGQATIAWPKTVSIKSGAEYRLSWDGKPAPTKLTFATLASVPSDPGQIEQALTAQQCQAQLDLLKAATDAGEAG
jgi:hypothetical protein